MTDPRRSVDDNATLAAEHAALRAAHDELQDRFTREQRAHDREREARGAAAAELALLRAQHLALEARSAALARELAAIGRSGGWRIDRSLRALVARHPELIARLRRFSMRHPRIHRLLRPVAQLAWWTATLQLRRRVGARWRRSADVLAKSGTFVAASAAALENPRFRLRPLFDDKLRPSTRDNRRLICVTHLLPYPPRAGNEYRVSRMLTWLERHGWEVLLIVCPPADKELPEDRIRPTAAAFSNLIVCRHDGTLLHHLSRDRALLDPLDGRRPRSFGAALDEADIRDAQAERTTDILRTFCPDILVELLLHLEQHFDPQVLLAEYVFMTRAFPLLGPKLRKVIDTIDVFSNKERKVEQYGIDEDFTLAEREEAALLARADLLIAIQPDEATDLRRLAPATPVISVGVDFDLADPAAPAASAPVTLLVASDNNMNIRGLEDFLRFAWPLVRRDMPDAELHVVGSVGSAAEVSSPGVRVLGRVEDVDVTYAQARVVINPAVAGTGLKIKTAEALCHFRPVVAWPSGVEGIALEARAMCHVANDWFDFAQQVIRLLRVGSQAQDSAPQRQNMNRHFGADGVYAPLAEALGTP